MTQPGHPGFGDDAVPMDLLRQRAFNLRWATLPPDVIPLTAADPDFPTAPVIREAIADYAASGLFSYGPAAGLPEFRETAAHHMAARKGVPTKADQIIAVDSAAAGMRHIAQFALKPGDEAIVFDPVDFLFKAAIEAAGGTVRLLPVDPATGRVDLSALPDLVSPRTRLLGVCNPLNPVGSLLTRDELFALGTLAVEHNLWVLNDEIWSDIVHAPGTFTSLPSLAPEIAGRCFTVQGFSKAFGLAGLRIGFVAAPTPEAARELLAVTLAETTMSGASTLSQVAATAAMRDGWEWFAGFLGHLTAMRDLAVERLNGMPGVSVRPPDGTFVLFPDISALGITSTDLTQRLLDEARVAVVPGAARWFGPGAEGHIRICFSTSAGILGEGLDRIDAFISGLVNG